MLLVSMTRPLLHKCYGAFKRSHLYQTQRDTGAVASSRNLHRIAEILVVARSNIFFHFYFFSSRYVWVSSDLGWCHFAFQNQFYHITADAQPSKLTICIETAIRYSLF